MSNLRIGVIGLGLRTSLAVAAHQPARGFEVAALCDTDPAALAKAVERVGVDRDGRATTASC